MTDIDPRLAAALEAQLRRWRIALADGAERVGWKLGMGDRERIGDGPVIGHLTSKTLLDSGAAYPAAGAEALHADAEVAIELERDVGRDADLDDAREAIAGFAAALEIVDLGGTDDAQAIVADNVFHRAVVLGPSHRTLPARVEAELVVNGEVRAAADATTDFGDRILVVARLLAAMGERLRAGDRIITGSIVQVPVAPGDEVTAIVGDLGRPTLTIAA